MKRETASNIINKILFEARIDLFKGEGIYNRSIVFYDTLNKKELTTLVNNLLGNYVLFGDI